MDESYKNLSFFHKVKLNNGDYTPGIVDIERLRDVYQFDSIPFDNKSVLDVGCWDGYFSFESEKKGTSEVVSLDNPNYRWGGMNGYNYLHNHYNSNAKFVTGNVYKLKDSLSDKKFDIVLCYGVLYHLSDPLLALKNLFEVCNDSLILEGVFYDSKNKSMELIDLGFANDKSNIYSISSGYINYISNIYGFKVMNYVYHSGHRASILLKRYKETNDGYIINAV